MTTYVCRTCCQVKLRDDFPRDRTKRSGVQSNCRVCDRAANKAWREANRDRNSKRASDWQRKNKDRVAVRNSRWKAANRPTVNATEARRRAAKLNAVAQWADHDLISDIYRYAKIMREAGLACDVDHIVPLQNVAVCGLHVHSNLTVLLASDNRSKGSRFVPGAPL